VDPGLPLARLSGLEQALRLRSGVGQAHEAAAEFIAARGDKPRNVGDREQVLQFAPLLPSRWSVVTHSSARRAIADQVAEVSACGITQLTIFPTPLPGQTTESVLKEFVERVLPRL